MIGHDSGQSPWSGQNATRTTRVSDLFWGCCAASSGFRCAQKTGVLTLKADYFPERTGVGRFCSNLWILGWSKNPSGWEIWQAVKVPSNTYCSKARWCITGAAQYQHCLEVSKLDKDPEPELSLLGASFPLRSVGSSQKSANKIQQIGSTEWLSPLVQ